MPSGSLKLCAADLATDAIKISHEQVDEGTSLCLVLERKFYLAAGHVS